MCHSCLKELEHRAQNLVNLSLEECKLEWNSLRSDDQVLLFVMCKHDKQVSPLCKVLLCEVCENE